MFSSYLLVLPNVDLFLPMQLLKYISFLANEEAFMLMPLSMIHYDTFADPC